MEKTSKILSKLQTETEKQQENIYQIHTSSVESLNKKFENLLSTKLNEIELNIQRDNKNTLKEIKQELQSLKKWKIYKYIGIAVLSSLTGFLLCLWLTWDWIVPGKMRYTQGNKKYIVEDSDKVHVNKEHKKTIILLRKD